MPICGAIYRPPARDPGRAQSYQGIIEVTETKHSNRHDYYRLTDKYLCTGLSGATLLIRQHERLHHCWRRWQSDRKAWYVQVDLSRPPH